MADTEIFYTEYAPPDDLTDVIHCVWRFQTDMETEPQPIVPDGRPELIIHLGAPYCEAGQSEPQPQALFAGQLTKPLILLPQGRTDIIAVRFTPDGGAAILQEDMSAATDRRIDMKGHITEAEHQIISSVLSARSDSERLDHLYGFIRHRMIDSRTDTVIRHSVKAIMADEDFTLPGDIGQRQYQRRFKSQVGISARDLRSIRRFRSLFDPLQYDECGTWTERALRAGYFDHPQMARDFQRFLGQSARQWIMQRDGLAKELSETPG